MGRFADGSCQDAGSTRLVGSCIDVPNCMCQTTWVPAAVVSADASSVECTDADTEDVHWDSGELTGCCQMPKKWMTEPHDKDGVKVPPLPYPFSIASGIVSACGLDYDVGNIPHSAMFADGSCQDAGST